jgi:hypothetical protein
VAPEGLAALADLGGPAVLVDLEGLVGLAALADPESLEDLVVLEDLASPEGPENLEEAGPRQSNGSITRSTGKEFPTATQHHGTSIPLQTVPAWTTGWTPGGMTSPAQEFPIGLQAGNQARRRTGGCPIELVLEPRAGTMLLEGWIAAGR